MGNFLTWLFVGINLAACAVLLWSWSITRNDRRPRRTRTHSVGMLFILAGLGLISLASLSGVEGFVMAAPALSYLTLAIAVVASGAAVFDLLRRR